MSVYAPELRMENRTALLLAKQLYNDQVRAFVGTSAARLKYAQANVERIAQESAGQTGADPTYVLSRLNELIAAEMKVNPDGLPNKADHDLPSEEGVEQTNVLDHGPVLEEKAREFGRQVDLGQYTQKWSCARCGTSLEKEAAVCEPCNIAIVTAAQRVAELPRQPGVGDVVEVSDENRPHRCVGCLTEFPTKLDAQNHAEHCPQAQQKLREFEQGGYQQTAAIEGEESLEVPGSESPADRFDNIVQNIADREAALAFSRANDDDVAVIAERYGLDEEEVRASLEGVATFGDYTAVNGSLAESVETEGKTEVTLEDSRTSREALVPLALAVRKTAEDLSMEQRLVESMVQERYGGVDLPDKWHAAVNGERRFFLPANMVASSES